LWVCRLRKLAGVMFGRSCSSCAQCTSNNWR
jgi:hypothetical protein